MTNQFQSGRERAARTQVTAQSDKGKAKARLASEIEGEQVEDTIRMDGYLKRVEEICRMHNVLFIADEIQSGGRSLDGPAVEWATCPINP